MPGRIELVLPGLFEIPPTECDADLLEQGLPHLNFLLRFARARGNQAFGIDAILRDVLCPGGEPEANAPVAMARAASGDEETAGTRLLLFKPVYLQTGLHNALIVPIPEDDDTRKETSIIISDLKDLFNVDCDIDILFIRGNGNLGRIDIEINITAILIKRAQCLQVCRQFLFRILIRPGIKRKQGRGAQLKGLQ